MKDPNDIEEGSKDGNEGNNTRTYISQAEKTVSRSDAPSVVTTNMTSKSTASNSSNVLVAVNPSILQLVTSVENSDNDEDEYERESHLCCGFCCDLRRACIILDVIQISMIVAVTIVIQLDVDPRFVEGFDTVADSADVDDEVAADFDRRFVETTVRLGGGVLFSVIGILGACLFNRWLVVCTGIWQCIAMVFSMRSRSYTGIVAAASFAYAHIAMFLELRRGKLTRENYAREQACCPRC